MNIKLFMVLLLVISSRLAAQSPQTTSMDDTHKMILSKTYPVPLDKVWQAWVDETLVKQWWGPHGFIAPLAKMDFREGGISLVCMRSPDGFELYNSWTYTRIIPGHSITFILHFTDKDGNVIAPSALGLPPGIPAAVQHDIVFEDLDNGSTRLTVTESGYTDAQVVEISKTGMQQCLDKMEHALLQREGTIQRTEKE